MESLLTVRRRNFFYSYRSDGQECVTADIDSSATGVDYHDTVTILGDIISTCAPRADVSHLHRLVGETILYTEVQTRFAFGYEVDAGLTRRGVGDEASHGSRLAHLALLKAFPTVGVGQDELDPVLKRRPKALPICMCLSDVSLGAGEKVGEEIGKHGYRALALGKRWKVRPLEISGVHTCRTEVELKPGIWVSPRWSSA